MKKFPRTSVLVGCALRVTLFLGAGLAFVQPCEGGFGIFENTGSLVTARANHTATKLSNDQVLVAGGSGGGDNLLASAELYNPANGTWMTTGALSAPRTLHTATLLNNGKVLVAGGSGTGGELATAELYDPASGTWTATGSLHSARSRHTATVLLDGKVLVVGGQYGVGTLPRAELYDPASGTWTTTGSLATERFDHTATLLTNGQVLVAGGTGAGDLTSAELYDPASGTWMATGSLATARSSYTATRLHNDQVLVAGGSRSFPAGSIDSAELYDPVSGSWTPTGSLHGVRQGHTATLLTDGRVLVAAGVRSRTGYFFLASAELYDPASGRWTATGSLATERSNHTATWLPNDQVLVAGGQNLTDYLASAQLYSSTSPVITSPLVATGTIGLPFVYQFQASGATSLGATNLAPGLTFDTSLRWITGVPTSVGTFHVDLSATNSIGTTNATLTIIVQAIPTSVPFIVSSTSATGRTGRPFSFQLQAIGGSSATHFTVDVLPPGLSLDPPTGFISGTPTADGSFSLAIHAIDGAATSPRHLLELTLVGDPLVPIMTSANSATLTPGQFFSYTITADADGTFGYVGTDGSVHQGPSPSCAGLPDGLCFDGVDTISGVFTGNPTPSTDVKADAFDRNANGGPSGVLGLSGGIVTNVQLFATDPSGTGTFPLVGFIAAKGTVNISTRLQVGTGDNVLIGGFIITGTGTTRALIRAIGPSLVPFGIPNALQDPTLELHGEGGAVLAATDNWGDTQHAAIQATGIPPTDNLEAAILAYLSPGFYTAIVRGQNNTMGVALVEVYDLGVAFPSPAPASNAKLANISTRGVVDTGNNVIIGGFIIRPQAPATNTMVVIRAIGPSLTPFGIANALQDPLLDLHDGNGSTMASNDDWQQADPASVQEIQQRGLAPTDTHESAILTSLPVGPYTAIVSGKNNTTGVALVEAYVLQ